MDQKEKNIRLRFKPLIDRYKRNKNEVALEKYEILIQAEIKAPSLDKSKKSKGGN